jgi:hypothetical protein
MNSNQQKSLVICIPLLMTSLLITTTAVFSQTTWTEHVIHNNTHGTASIHVCDLDNDSDLDVLGAVLEDNQMVWWRNEGGYPIVWTKFTIGTNFFSAFSVYAADIDNDGDQDALGAAGDGDQIAWWENGGGNPIQWTKHTIRTLYDFAHEVYAHDLDEDGDMDVFGASSNLGLISWWRNEGGNPVQWTEQTIGANFDGAKSVRVADLDDDGDNDVIGACLYGHGVTYWRNDGGDPITWTTCPIDDYLEGAHRVQAVDLDEDGDLDVLAVGYLASQIVWYSNDGGDPIQWTKQIIGTNFHAACIAQAADLDGDGDLDVAASAQTSNQVAWWRNEGGNPIVWTKFYIDEYFYRVWPLYVCDLDEDNDQDVVAASGWAGVNQVNWYENTSTAITETRDQRVSQHFTGPTIIRGSLLSLIDKNSKIYDIAGKEIKSTNPTPGIYFLKTDNKTITKIVKIQ